MQELNLCVRKYYDTSYYRAMSNVAERTFRVIWDESGCAITGLEIAENYILSERSTALFDQEPKSVGIGKQ